jgi:hypothetical protein
MRAATPEQYHSEDITPKRNLVDPEDRGGVNAFGQKVVEDDTDRGPVTLTIVIDPLVYIKARHQAKKLGVPVRTHLARTVTAAVNAAEEP